MQASRPHCELEVHVLPPGGTTRQLLPRQYSPMWQSELPEQVSSQTPCTQLCPEVQSAVVEHVGSFSQVPL
jgi:hypothetical protein